MLESYSSILGIIGFLILTVNSRNPSINTCQLYNTWHFSMVLSPGTLTPLKFDKESLG